MSAGDAVASTLRKLVSATHPVVDLVNAARYRLRSQAADRVALQRINAGDNTVAEVTPVRVLPGIPGASAVMQPGAEVLVAFVGQQRSPYVVAHPAEGQQGHVPITVRLEAQGQLRLVPGDSAAGASGVVQIGPDAAAPISLATAPGLTAVLTPLSAALGALQAWAVFIDFIVTAIPPPGSAALQALVAAIAAAQTAISNGNAPHPGGYQTTKVTSS